MRTAPRLTGLILSAEQLADRRNARQRQKLQEDLRSFNRITLALLVLAAVLLFAGCEDPTCRAIFVATVHHNELGEACGLLVATADVEACGVAAESCDDLDRTFAARLVECTAKVDPCDGKRPRGERFAEEEDCEVHARALRDSCRSALEAAGAHLRFPGAP